MGSSHWCSFFLFVRCFVPSGSKVRLVVFSTKACVLVIAVVIFRQNRQLERPLHFDAQGNFFVFFWRYDGIREARLYPRSDGCPWNSSGSAEIGSCVRWCNATTRLPMVRARKPSRHHDALGCFHLMRESSKSNQRSILQTVLPSNTLDGTLYGGAGNL